MIIIAKGLSLVFILMVPVFLVTASVTWAVNDLRLYSHGFEKYEISGATGIEQDDLMMVAGELRAYFNSAQEPLEVRAPVFGQERTLFSAKEVAHMEDVKDLVWEVYIAGAAAGTYLLVVTLGGFLRRGLAFATTLSRWTLWGGGLTIGLIGAFGLTALVAFEWLFQVFHQVSFANDFWKLDPATDYLVIMFPEGFWLDATLFVALVSLGGALLLSAVSGGYLLARRRRAGQRAQV
jgi:integral membrane protein (TIGR01906 family)